MGSYRRRYDSPDYAREEALSVMSKEKEEFRELHNEILKTTQSVSELRTVVAEFMVDLRDMFQQHVLSVKCLASEVHESRLEESKREAARLESEEKRIKNETEMREANNKAVDTLAKASEALLGFMKMGACPWSPRTGKIMVAMYFALILAIFISGVVVKYCFI